MDRLQQNEVRRRQEWISSVPWKERKFPSKQ